MDLNLDYILAETEVGEIQVMYESVTEDKIIATVDNKYTVEAECKDGKLHGAYTLTDNNDRPQFHYMANYKDGKVDELDHKLVNHNSYKHIVGCYEDGLLKNIYHLEYADPNRYREDVYMDYFDYGCVCFTMTEGAKSYYRLATTGTSRDFIINKCITIDYDNKTMVEVLNKVDEYSYWSWTCETQNTNYKIDNRWAGYQDEYLGSSQPYLAYCKYTYHSS
jgi:hypothetical protein